MNNTDKENLNIHIESILYYTGETFSIVELSKTFGATASEVEEALQKLGSALEGRGVELMRTNDKVSLATAKASHTMIEKIRREELDKELSKASMETLACILYKGEITRSEIDFVRGVNSSFILRN
mgnify:FL=1